MVPKSSANINMMFGELQFMDFIKNRSTKTNLQNFNLAIFVICFCLSLFIELLKPVLHNTLKYFQNEAKKIIKSHFPVGSVVRKKYGFCKK